ncbi:MAG: D-glycero-beta-D-manno-heptose 1,7-bisphosphate 7-phosphatase [Woeseiaceae bacterium]
MSRHLVILDRDGVINHDSDAFIKSPEEWRPIKGSAEAIGKLTKAGFTVVVASNQSGLGRNLLDRQTLDAIHRKMEKCVRDYGGAIDKIFFCPHRPDDGCVCRKPKPGLLLEAAQHYAMSLDGVPVIGDSLRDLDAALAVRARPMLVLTGNGKATAAALADQNREMEIFADLADAATSLIADSVAE